MDSQAKHALTAMRHADLYVRIAADPQYREQIWDQAAGTLTIEEAGGRVGVDLRETPHALRTIRRSSRTFEMNVELRLSGGYSAKMIDRGPRRS